MKDGRMKCKGWRGSEMQECMPEKGCDQGHPSRPARVVTRFLARLCKEKNSKLWQGQTRKPPMIHE